MKHQTMDTQAHTVRCISRIVINATRIGEVGGLRTFTEALAQCLSKGVDVVSVVPLGVKLSADIQQWEVPSWLASSSKVSVLRPILWWIYSLFFFPDGPGERILSSTHHAVPFRKQQIITIHDLRPYFYPDSWLQKLNFRWFLPQSLKRCSGVLTVSNVSKQLIVSTYGVSPANIHVVPPQVDSEFFTPKDFQSVPEQAQYLLCVGSSWKHKNIDELLRMHAHWSDGYKLKIVAGTGQYLEALKTMAISLKIESKIDFLSNLTRTELRSLYQGCAALVYPSLMEGFGLPPLEAMAAGRPTIVSDIPLFREVYGEAPIYVRLGETESWQQAFCQLRQFSKARLESGICHARSYTRARMCRQLSMALDQIWGVR
jgi:glycosyltransferase involved in cell wall biosynthesis